MGESGGPKQMSILPMGNDKISQKKMLLIHGVFRYVYCLLNNNHILLWPSVTITRTEFFRGC